MPGTYDHDRMRALLHGKGELNPEDWAWINRYLSLADKVFRDAKETEQPVTFFEQVNSILDKKAS